MLNVLSREVLPRSSRTSAVRKPSARVRSACAARFAAPDSGGAVTRRTNRPARIASIRSAPARGITRTGIVTRSAIGRSDRRGKGAEDQTRHDLNRDERDERREVDTAEEGHRAPDRRQDRLADAEDEVAETEGQTRVRDPREDDAYEDRERQRSREHVDKCLDEDDQEAGGAHSRYTSRRYRDGVGPVCP